MEYFFAILIVAIFPNLICETHSERKIEVLCPLSYYTSCRSWYKSESTYSACIICQPLSSYVSSEVEICVANGQLGDSSIEYNKYTCPDINGSNSHEWCKQNLKFGMKVDVTKSNFLLAMESSEGLFDSRSQIPEFACLPDYTMKRVEMRNRFYLEHLNLQTHCIDKIHIGNQSFCVTNHPDFCIVCVQEPYTHSICLSTKSSQLAASTSNLPSLVFKHEDCPYGLLASPVGCSKDVDAISTLIGEKYVGLRLGPGHNFMFNASNLIRKSSFVYPKKGDPN